MWGFLTLSGDKFENMHMAPLHGVHYSESFAQISI